MRFFETGIESKRQETGSLIMVPKGSDMTVYDLYLRTIVTTWEQFSELLNIIQLIIFLVIFYSSPEPRVVCLIF